MASFKIDGSILFQKFFNIFKNCRFPETVFQDHYVFVQSLINLWRTSTFYICNLFTSKHQLQYIRILHLQRSTKTVLQINICWLRVRQNMEWFKIQYENLSQ